MKRNGCFIQAAPRAVARDNLLHTYKHPAVVKALAELFVIIVLSTGVSRVAAAAPDRRDSVSVSGRSAVKIKKTKSAGFTGEDIKYVAEGYRILYSALVQVLVERAAVPKDKAEAAVDAFVMMTAMLGEAADNRPAETAVQDAVAAMWEKKEFQNVLMTMLAPFDMDNPKKTKNLLRLSRDLNSLGQDPPENKIRKVMLRYLSQGATEVSISLINKGKAKKCGPLDYFDFSLQISLNFSPRNKQCVSKEDIVKLVEAHYEKKLPNLSAFIGGVEMWINNRDNAEELVKLGLAGISLQKLAAAAMEDGGNKKKIMELLEQSGINKGVFLYIVNSAPGG